MKSPAVAFYPMSGYARQSEKLRHFLISDFEDDADPVFNRFVPHRHDFFEVFWIREGAGELQLDLETVPFGPGSLFFISPRRVHSWKITIRVKGSIIRFTEEFFSVDSAHARLLARVPFSYDPTVPPCFPVEGAERIKIERLLVDLAAESLADGVGREDVLRARMVILLVALHRYLEARVGCRATPAVSLLAWRFRLKLDEHFPRLLKVSDYARLLGVSRSHLNDGLREQVGQTASELIHDRVVLEAKRLLMHSTLTISEIAYHLHFRDPSYFVRFFRRHSGLTPGQYRASTELAASRRLNEVRAFSQHRLGRIPAPAWKDAREGTESLSGKKIIRSSGTVRSTIFSPKIP